MLSRPFYMSGNTPEAQHGGSAVRDELTAAFSRSYFIDAVEIERQLAVETGRAFSVCLIDIDQLRNVNDQYGLLAGDAVVAGVAETIRQSLDLPQWQNLRCLQARFDGDSLILLLPGCPVQRAEQFAHVVRRRVTDEEYAGSISVTISLAVTAYSDSESLDELLARAERTMNLAKQFGGDCVEVVRLREPKRQTATVTRLPVAFKHPPEDGS
jgi:diguanylate cyclase (GGDEF)-like protein